MPSNKPDTRASAYGSGAPVQRMQIRASYSLFFRAVHIAFSSR